jgi:hypothetical protein
MEITDPAQFRKSAMVVIYGDTCRGFVLNRGRNGFEAFDIDQHSLGIFPSERDAVGVLFEPIASAS